jgi:hypothetical protein
MRLVISEEGKGRGEGKEVKDERRREGGEGTEEKEERREGTPFCE